MDEKRLTKLNISISLIHQLVTAVCALILPRFILLAFNSEVNGLMQSISQILSYTTLMEMGVGGVVLASLYKPLADGNAAEISSIFNTTKSIFARISGVFIAFALVLSLVAKFIIRSDFTFGYVCLMVIILAINTFFNYYFALPHQLLLKADRRLYVVQSVQIVTTVLNLAVCVIAIKLNASVHTVKLVSAFVFILNPICYRLYVKKHYEIMPAEKTHSLGQKKDAFIHHIAYFIHRNTDIVIISVMSTLKMASVYSVYNAVIVAIENILNAVSSALAGIIGNKIAKGEKTNLINSFDLYEGVNTFMTAVFFTVAAVLILPFTALYTTGVDDAKDYIQPAFAYVIIMAGVMYCVRIPYISLASAAGHYKETRTGAMGEVLLNVILSLALVKPMGITGVAVGTFVAMSFRTFYTVWYLSKNIIDRPIMKFVKSFAVNLAFGVLLVIVIRNCVNITVANFFEFALYGIGISAIVFGILAVVNVLLNFETIKKVRK